MLPNVSLRAHNNVVNSTPTKVPSRVSMTLYLEYTCRIYCRCMWSGHRLREHATILHHLSWKHSGGTIFRAGCWWRPVRFTSVPQWALSSKLLQERCSYWMATTQRRIHECTAINQAFLREVFVLGYQSAAVKGDRCVNTCGHSQRGAREGAVLQLFVAI